MREGKVYLAGGGCGDAELVTLRALKVLQQCHTVVYDNLVSEKLLQWTRPDCEKIYVGKRYGSHAMKQSEINALLVQKAREGKTVVRLKGGDPYVFGRGGEEFIAVREAGIFCEEIPGITSAIAVPAAAGIPVTHRGLSDNVTVVTGTAADKGGQEALHMDFETLARLDGTLVILMGMHHLPEIVTGLLAAGKDPNMPCAIIMEGTTGHQKTLRSPLAELSARAAEQGFSSPAVIVVGAVAKLELAAKREDDVSSERASCMGQTEKKSVRPAEWQNVHPAERQYVRQMADITVGVTGTRHFVDRISSALRVRGFAAWDMSFMEIKPTKEALPDLTDYGWLVFTSPNGVKVFLDKLKQEQCDLRTLSDKKIAVIGPGTASVLQEAGIYADYMPKVYDVAHLARGLADEIRAAHRGTASCSAVFLRAKQGSDILPLVFREKEIPCEEFALYELTVQEQKREAVIAKEPDYLIFGSAMGARAYFEGLRKSGRVNTKSQYVCMGEWCAAEVQKYVKTPVLTAEESSVYAVAECICREIEKRKGKEHDVSIQKTEKG